jgi:hypothetical protein
MSTAAQTGHVWPRLRPEDRRKAIGRAERRINNILDRLQSGFDGEAVYQLFLKFKFQEFQRQAAIATRRMGGRRLG